MVNRVYLKIIFDNLWIFLADITGTIIIKKINILGFSEETLDFVNSNLEEKSIKAHYGAINHIEYYEKIFNVENLLLTSSTDKSIKIWSLHYNGDVSCILSIEETFKSVNLARLFIIKDYDQNNKNENNYSFIISGSKDETIKVYKIVNE
jgi:WD40 repeat protein